MSDRRDLSSLEVVHLRGLVICRKCRARAGVESTECGECGAALPLPTSAAGQGSQWFQMGRQLLVESMAPLLLIASMAPLRRARSETETPLRRPGDAARFLATLQPGDLGFFSATVCAFPIVEGMKICGTPAAAGRPFCPAHAAAVDEQALQDVAEGGATAVPAARAGSRRRAARAGRDG